MRKASCSPMRIDLRPTAHRVSTYVSGLRLHHTKIRFTSLLFPPRPHFRFVRPFLYISIPIMNGNKVSSSLFEKKKKKRKKKKRS